MKSKKKSIILLSTFFLGIFILLYPMVSQQWNSRVQSQAITKYEGTINKISTEEYKKMLEDATNYNKKLSKLAYPFVQYKNIGKYESMLDFNGAGMMGYVSIPKIKVELPIYHGTGAEVLNAAVGHLEGSSLPVGGKGTHSVLSAHRGLPSSKLFTDLNRLEIGDTFTVTILDKTLTYEVDNIKTVKPSQVNNIKIEKGEDYVTLLTCTPYGINTHRLLVRGKRVEAEELKVTHINSEAYLIDRLIVTSVISLIILFILMVYIMVKPIKKNINIKEVIK